MDSVWCHQVRTAIAYRTNRLPNRFLRCFFLCTAIAYRTNHQSLYPLGSKFTYNSDDYIQHLSYVLSAVTGQDAVTYASENFAAPLGVPDYYAYDKSGIDGSGTHAPVLYSLSYAYCTHTVRYAYSTLLYTLHYTRYGLRATHSTH
jgi:CubicO group peptidase (beta-lactamase class C family)